MGKDETIALLNEDIKMRVSRLSFAAAAGLYQLASEGKLNDPRGKRLFSKYMGILNRINQLGSSAGFNPLEVVKEKLSREDSEGDLQAIAQSSNASPPTVSKRLRVSDRNKLSSSARARDYLGLTHYLSETGITQGRIQKTIKALDSFVAKEPYLLEHRITWSRGFRYEDTPKTRKIIKGLLDKLNEAQKTVEDTFSLEKSQNGGPEYKSSKEKRHYSGRRRREIASAEIYPQITSPVLPIGYLPFDSSRISQRTNLPLEFIAENQALLEVKCGEGGSLIYKPELLEKLQSAYTQKTNKG